MLAGLLDPPVPLLQIEPGQHPDEDRSPQPEISQHFGKGHPIVAQELTPRSLGMNLCYPRLSDQQRKVDRCGCSGLAVKQVGQDFGDRAFIRFGSLASLLFGQVAAVLGE
ncbi:MAG TPA: hypothetical protein VN363_01940 [Anaerolineales bacterium]|nr:hypothetical protein [Anaerolineales bacterium]